MRSESHDAASAFVRRWFSALAGSATIEAIVAAAPRTSSAFCGAELLANVLPEKPPIETGWPAASTIGGGPSQVASMPGGPFQARLHHVAHPPANTRRQTRAVARRARFV